MKKIFLLILISVTFIHTQDCFASYLGVAVNSGKWDGDCVVDGTGSISSGGSSCDVYIPIPIESGNTLSSVVLYFYDNSGSQYIYATLYRSSLSSDSNSILDVNDDTYTSASVQYFTLSYGSSTSSSYVYYILAMLDDGTELRSAKVYYY